MRSKIHTMENRNEEKYVVKYANTDRLKNSAIPYMQRMLNDDIRRKYSNHHLTISKTFRKNTAIEVTVQDAISQNIIIHEERPATRDHQIFYNIGEFVENGTSLIKVTIKDLRKGKKEYYTIDWSKYLIQE